MNKLTIRRCTASMLFVLFTFSLSGLPYFANDAEADQEVLVGIRQVPDPEPGGRDWEFFIEFNLIEIGKTIYGWFSDSDDDDSDGCNDDDDDSDGCNDDDDDDDSDGCNDDDDDSDGCNSCDCDCEECDRENCDCD